MQWKGVGVKDMWGLLARRQDMSGKRIRIGVLSVALSAGLMLAVTACTGETAVLEEGEGGRIVR